MCVSVCPAGRTVQRGRISCYCLRKTVLQYRNVSYAMLFCYTHTHTHTHNRLSVYETSCAAVHGSVSVSFQVCVFTCVYLTLIEVSWHSRHNWLSSRLWLSNACDEGRCTLCLEEQRVCKSGGRNNLMLMKKLKFHMIYLNVWRHQNVLLPLDHQGSISMYMHINVYVTATVWKWEQCHTLTDMTGHLFLGFSKKG